MNAGDTHVVERLDPAAHDLSSDPRFLCDRHVGRSSRNHQHMTTQPPLGIADGHQARVFMIPGTSIDPLDNRGDRRCGSRRQKRPMVFEEHFRDSPDLCKRLPLAQNHFGKSLPDRPVMVERCKSQVLEWQRSKLLERLRNRQAAALHVGQQPFKTFRIHVRPFSGLATRSIRSLTAFLQDLPSKRTALISCTIGISTP